MDRLREAGDDTAQLAKLLEMGAKVDNIEMNYPVKAVVAS